MPNFYMLVGMPASGKSTWAKKFIKDKNIYYLSADDYIETQAFMQNKTYTEVFTSVASDAAKYVESQAKVNFSQNYYDVVWDQTNLTVKTRADRLAFVPKHWNKVAIVFYTPERDVWLERLNSRPDKTIPQVVLNSMKKSFVMPTTAEGFDSVRNYNSTS